MTDVSGATAAGFRFKNRRGRKDAGIHSLNVSDDPAMDSIVAVASFR